MDENLKIKQIRILREYSFSYKMLHLLDVTFYDL
jgi:hypothetical protein